ncbi:MAG: sugar phosphate nucleotidyltransferase [Pseudomonadota bacterium]
MGKYDDVAVIILAAGKGTRMKSEIAKVLHKVANKSMVVHVIESAAQIAPENIHIVVGHQAQSVKDEILKYYHPNFVLQQTLQGTGDAVKTALPHVNAKINTVLVLCGDVPLIQPKTLGDLVDGHMINQSKVTVLATQVENPTGYGRIVTGDDGRMLCIKEEADANEKEKHICKVNTGIYCFDCNFLRSSIHEILPNNMQSEYYLTDLIEIARKKEAKIVVVTMNDPDQVMGVNTLNELERAELLIQKR